MAIGIPDTEETRKEWRKSGLRYEPDLQERLYKDFLTETTAERLSEYTNHKETELQSINVHLVPDGDDIDEFGNSKSTKGWITYAFSHDLLVSYFFWIGVDFDTCKASKLDCTIHS